jgi:hypothetical protein
LHRLDRGALLILVVLAFVDCTIVADPFWGHLFIFENMQKNRDFENV